VSGFELVSNIVTGAMWPLVVLILGMTFRDTLKSVLERLKGFEALGAKLELSDAVKKLDEAADSVEIQEAEREAVDKNAPTGGSGTRITVERQLPLRHLVEVARFSPAAAIVDAWREVEVSLLKYWQTLRKLAVVPDEKYRDVFRIVRSLIEAEQITPQQAELLQRLRATRNAVAHGQEQPSEGQALAFVEAAGQAINSLARDKWAVETGEI
jgi:hypothetical protein